MNTDTELHDIIFVTDKYGKRNKTGDISRLQYDSHKDVYFITYKDGKTYPCKSSDIQIIKNCTISCIFYNTIFSIFYFSKISNDLVFT